MDEKLLQRLLERARADAGFFHDLVFDTERAIGNLDDLPADVRERLLKLDPETVLGTIVTGSRKDCTVTVQCTWTCGQTASLLDRHADPRVNRSDCTVTVVCGSTCTKTVSSRLPLGELDYQIRSQLEGQLGAGSLG
ncbi:MAG TPA: hypothetical protein VFE33_23030 [Thermoanaerobaculia bacterium]|nr:hypothetical protein [Thermoanaerobaculia bacterium]